MDCCEVDLPARVLDTEQPTRVWITAPLHVCGKPEVGMHCVATWECSTGLARSNGTVEVQQQRPRRWRLCFDGRIEHLTIEERYPDDSPGFLDLGFARLPARITDRSFHGVGCVVPALAQLEPGQRVSVRVGDHERAGTIARVRGFGNQVKVGIRLDEL
jgi:hypothetical protein